MTTKVNNTVSRLTSQGTRTVTLGIFKMIEVSDNYVINTLGLMGRDKYPFIVSETDRIEEEDLIYNKTNRLIAECTWSNDWNVEVSIRNESIKWVKSECIKVLAIPRNFSEKHLASITSNKLSDGDKAWIVCNRLDSYGAYRAGGGPPCADMVVDIDDNGHMTMLKYSDEYKIVMPVSVCHDSQVVASGANSVFCTSCGKPCETRLEEFLPKGRISTADNFVDLACGFAMDKLYEFNSFKNAPVPSKEQMSKEFRSYVNKNR